MKTTLFVGAQMRIESRSALDGHISAVIVPTLSAYAVEYAEFTPPRHIDAEHIQFHSGADFEIVGDKVRFYSGFVDIFGGLERNRLVIHYHGIRDHEALFPQIADASFRRRLGQFYQEAEATFDSGSWLAFVLMAAAVFEGLLASRLGVTDGKFVKLIDSALDQKIIGANDVTILNRAREHRNLVHAALHATSYVQRTDAMDMRTTLDGLIRKLSGWLPGNKIDIG